MARLLLAIGLLFCLSACATVPEPSPPETGTESPPLPEPVPTQEPQPDVPAPNPEPSQPEPSQPEPTPAPSPTTPPPVLSEPASVFSQFTYWNTADLRPAYQAFRRTCLHWEKKAPEKTLHSDRPEYGTFSDWQSPCALAKAVTAADRDFAKRFFESEFLPVPAPSNGTDSLLTGYYQPEISVRKTPDKIHREPILAVPSNPTVKTLPRDQITAASSRVIAFGKPIDVFFMQIQGSGILAFDDGRRLRAAYADNNGYAYTSIGRILVERGEITKDQASKQTIESWMKTAGPVKARALMNENKRYIFFKEENLTPGEGPLGAMRVPLSAMGSLAIDTGYYPYGVPVWLQTRLPAIGGDYRGETTGLLVITQDTGRAIRGAQRGDIYFGTGFEAGEKAGVMKHGANWTLLLPRALAAKHSGPS